MNRYTFPHHVFKLNKALYGLKQTPRAWYEKLSSISIENGFIRGKVDTNLFPKDYGNQFLFVQIYVDNIIFGATNESLCEGLSKLMQTKFEISMMGELKFFLGLQIKQTNEGIYIHQSKYMKELLKKFKRDDAKLMKTSMHPTTVLGLDNELKVDEKTYKGMIGSLLYLIASILDVMFSVCRYSRFRKEPREVHLSVVKRIFKYLIGTPNLGVCNKREKEYRFLGYCDAKTDCDALYPSHICTNNKRNK